MVFRLFRLRLKEAGENVFTRDVTFENSVGEIPFSQRKVVSGSLEDDGLASVDGVITEDGHFDGHIQTRDGLFYIEPANRYKFLRPQNWDLTFTETLFKIFSCYSRFPGCDIFF